MTPKASRAAAYAKEKPTGARGPGGKSRSGAEEVEKRLKGDEVGLLIIFCISVPIRAPCPLIRYFLDSVALPTSSRPPTRERQSRGHSSTTFTVKFPRS